ncbi:hypothetical protein HF086_006498 [Spodoptera exigua]|uniref:Bromodomain adjacent to zinc finger domain protein 2B-like n=1 Tax=Spodoptera exigua TaxID=7107 RepID=A0A922MN76_SPOEX|nr:hypothetical protein HF086_006498 [Spodoptera exigua]
MDKEGPEGEAGKAPSDGLLDAANLFGAYWGRDGASGGGAAAAQAQAQAQAALFGFGSRYPPPTTLGVAANQAASLGLHPAASAAWWSMASHLAAQDYLARLQASGLNFPPLADPYAALSALSGSGGLKQPQKPGKLSSRNERSGRSSTSSSQSTKDKSPSTGSANSQSMRSSYGLPKTSSPSAMHHSQSLSSLASLNSLVAAPHQSKPSNKPASTPQPSKKPSSSSSSSSSKGKERELALLRGDLMLAQAAAHGAYHAAVAAAAKGKNMSPLYPFGMPGTDKDGRHAGIDSLTGLPHTILSAALEGGDPSSVLGGVRLPPDTEIIKYTSSLAGPKAGAGTTTRGRKKTISLDPPHVSVHPADRNAPLPSKRPKLMGDDSPLDLGVKSAVVDEDAPLNLSLKPTPASSQASDALSRLTSLSSSLNASSSHDRISRRKPGAKPRRVAPELNPVPDAPRPKSSGSEDSECREGRPRNLGRGVSKPKKNTVASLLAQSRALGLRPALAHQLLAETDLEKLKALLGETASTDSECPSDSCPSDSDASDTSWKRVTVIKGLSRNCSIKGDVTYSPPDPHAGITMRSLHDIQNFLESNPCPPLSTDNFSFSARTVLGEYIQPASEVGEPLIYNESEINKRLEEARLLSGAGGRPTPPPLDRRMELARLQQAARDARRDASNRSRDQARLERSEKAELAKREKEARSQQLLEHINKNRTQLTIEPVPTVAKTGIDEWKTPEIVMGPATKTSKERIIPPISLSLIPVTGPKDQNSPIKTLKFDQSGWKEEYNALDKMKDFAEKAAFDLPKRKDKNFDFTLVKSAEKRSKAPEKTNNLEKLIESYSRITEFINGCDWSQIQGDKKTEDPKAIEQKYLNAKNEFMSQNLMLMPKESPKSVLREVIDLSEDDDILTDIMSKKINKGTFSVGKDGALSISVHPLSKETMTSLMGHYYDNQSAGPPEPSVFQMKENADVSTLPSYVSWIPVGDGRRGKGESIRTCWTGFWRPQEDSSLSDQKPLPTLPRIPGLKLPAQAMADLLQAYEFTYTFGEALGFDMETMPTLNTLQMGILGDCSEETEEEFVQVVSQLLIIAVEDPGIPHPGRHTTLLGHAIRMGDITHQNFSEVLRIYLYANATGEVKALTEHITCTRVRVLQARKARAEQAERSQALALERMQRLVDDSTRTTTPPLHDDENQQTPEKDETPKKDKESSPHPESETDKQSEPSPYKEPPPTEESDKELSPLKDLSNNMKNKEMMNNNKDECSLADNSKIDKDSMIGDCDANLSTREKKESPTSDAEKRDPETEAQKKEEALKSSSIKMEEKYIQQKNNDEQDMLDIEDSIPTAFLVQKPTHKPMFAAQAEQMDKPQEIVKVENVVKNENENETAEESKDSLVNNLEELRKMAEAVSIQLDAAKKEQEIKEEKEKVKKEAQDPNSAHLQLYSKMLDGKWFSILRHESSFLNNINDEKQDLPEFCDNEHTCSEIIMCQGHKWDVSNNLHLLNDPSLFTLNSMVTSVQVPSNNVYADSSLTMSGLDQDLIDNSFNKDGGVQEAEVEEDNKEQDNDLEKELQADALKQDMLTQKAKANSLNSLGLLNFNALSTYVTCDSPPPIQMSAEELDQLEYCKPYIDKGDIIATELCVSHLDRVIAMNGGYATDTSFSAATQRKVDMQLLSMVEQLEERVAAASMQVKGWRPTRATADAAPSEPVARAKHKLQVLEAHIERRYLKPPFVQRYASLASVLINQRKKFTWFPPIDRDRNIKDLMQH